MQDGLKQMIKSGFNRKKIISFSLFSLFLFLFLVNFVSATYQINKPMEITISCNGLDCSNVNLTLFNPDSDVVVDDQQTTDNSYYANYTYTPNVLGNYTYYYTDGAVNGTSSFEVTPSGSVNLTTFLFVFIVIIGGTYVLGVKTENNWIMLMASIMVLFFGFWVMIYGIDIIKDYTTTRAIGFVVWGVSFISGWKSLEGLVLEGFGK